jgi:Icc protein
MQILQLTDPHLYGKASGNLRGVETDSSLRHVLDDALGPQAEHEAIHPCRYSAILVTGDVVQDDPSGYLRFKSILGRLQTQVLCIPGNHDEPDAMRHSLRGAPFEYCGTHPIGDWQFIMLDTCNPGHVGGRMTPGELARLDATLAASPAHAFVCMHHHPIAMGSRWLDDVGLANAEEFWGVIDAHPHVRGIAWGHVHQAYEGQRKGVRLFATPSTCAQFLPQSDRYALDSRPPAYRRFELRANGTIDSEVRWVDTMPLLQVATR